MSDLDIKSVQLRAANGGDGVNDVRLYSGDLVRLTAEYLETIHSGDPASQFVRLTAEYVEAVHSGNPASQFVRLTATYIEVISTFGVPPVVGPGKGNNGNGNGNSGNAPGHNKPQVLLEATRLNRVRVERNSGLGAYDDGIVALYSGPQWLPPGAEAEILRRIRKIVQLKH